MAIDTDLEVDLRPSFEWQALVNGEKPDGTEVNIYHVEEFTTTSGEGSFTIVGGTIKFPDGEPVLFTGITCYGKASIPDEVLHMHQAQEKFHENLCGKLKLDPQTSKTMSIVRYGDWALSDGANFTRELDNFSQVAAGINRRCYLQVIVIEDRPLLAIGMGAAVTVTKNVTGVQLDFANTTARAAKQIRNHLKEK